MTGGLLRGRYAKPLVASTTSTPPKVALASVGFCRVLYRRKENDVFLASKVSFSITELLFRPDPLPVGIVNANGMKARPITLEGFQPVSGWFTQVLETCRFMQIQQLTSCSAV